MKLARCITFIFVFTSLCSNAQNRFLSRWLNDTILQPATVGFMLKALNNDSIYYDINAKKVLAPASTQKLISTAIALHHFGAAHTFKTKLAYTGEIRDGVLRGDIYVFPNHNPTLASERFGKDLTEITSVIKSWLSDNKIVSIGGGIKVIDSTITQQTLPNTWIWEDIGNYYGANPSGTVVNENKIEVYFESTAAGKATKIIKTVPDLPQVKIINRVRASTQNKDLAYAYGGPHARTMTIHGTIPANRKSFKVKIALQSPQKALAFMIHDALKKDQIVLKGKYHATAKPKKPHTFFGEINSAAVTEIINKTNTYSVNILAEKLLTNAHKSSNHKVSLNDFVKSYLTTHFNTPTNGLHIYDGSGLSRFNAISAEQLVNLLSYLSNNETYVNSLPIAGESGTIKSFLKNSSFNGSVRCKSGSMQGVKSYAGYIKTTSGKHFAFAIIINNAEASNYQVTKKIEELINHIGGL